MTLVYVEHPKNHLQSMACDMPGWCESDNGPSGIYHNFENDQYAIDFIWKIRNHSARYVEITESLRKPLEDYVKAKGFKSIKGLVSKIC